MDRKEDANGMSSAVKPSWHGIAKDNFLKYFSLEPRSNSRNHWLIVFDRRAGQPLKVPGNKRMYLKYSTSDRAVTDVIKMIKEGTITLQ